MAEKVGWSRRSLQDVADIENYIAVDSAVAGARMAHRLTAAAEDLAYYPDRGRSIGRGVRQLMTVRPYLITYRSDGRSVWILHIRHGRRRPLR